MKQDILFLALFYAAILWTIEGIIDITCSEQKCPYHSVASDTTS